MKKKRLAIISSHPIQYNAPMFATLARSAKVYPKVFYTWSQSQEKLFDKDFGKEIKWDIPLLEGYEYQFINNISKTPGPIGYKGIDCPDLIPAIKNWGAEAVLIYGWNYKAHYSTMKYFKGKIPVYFRGDSTLIDEKSGLKQMLRRLVLTHVYKKCDGAFYVGQHNKTYFLKHGFSPDKLYFAPHAIDNERFSSNVISFKQQAGEWREKLGIAKEDLVVLFVGKFESKKNPILLLEAFRHLNQTGSHLIFVGNGIYEEEMKHMAEGQINIHFLPFQNQQMMPVVYHLADVLALPSQGPGETWGLVVNEAMACEKAILLSDKTGCAPDLVSDNVNGRIFTSGDMQDCSAALKHLLKSKEGLEKMGNESFRIIQNWSFENIVKSLENHI
ncbi:MAG: group 1 glycosyl transferase [Bacteroidetes bacterium]|nr:MAG: group 1 glycosyl transferase [Bacteroidota bacterium]